MTKLILAAREISKSWRRILAMKVILEFKSHRSPSKNNNIKYLMQGNKRSKGRNTGRSKGRNN